MVCTSSRDVQLCLAILNLWLVNRSYKIYSPLDVVAISVEASAAPTKNVFKPVKWRRNVVVSVVCKDILLRSGISALWPRLPSMLPRWRNTLTSSGTFSTGWLRTRRRWGTSSWRMLTVFSTPLWRMTRTRCPESCLEESSDHDQMFQVRILYAAGFRLVADNTRRVNKDYLKKIKLFKARASPVYCTVAFEQSEDVEKDDPMKKCLEYALQAHQYANKIQDFNKDFNDIAEKCENFAITMLDKCTTKHEIQTLLQTKSYRGHHDANFNIAILDGHKELVAHEKFQQLLHKKWGQRDRVHYGEFFFV